MNRRGSKIGGWFVALLLLGIAMIAGADTEHTLGPLPAGPDIDADRADLGRHLFFDPRLSGDGSLSCASCHIPEQGWSDGEPLSQGYPGNEYFRRTRSIVNTAHKKNLYWDGRMDGSDLPTLVRDHIAEAHFMQADGRLVIERLRQIPFYERTFTDVMGGEPSYGKILNATAEFVRSVRSKNVPFDRYILGEHDAISESARKGYALFTGKARCVQCHDGPMLTDNDFHVTGVPENLDIFRDPMRHITFRRFLKTFGVSNYSRMDHDPGRFAQTHRDVDDRRFKTPSLREVSRTAPYMHNGALKTLQDVVTFYNHGGGDATNKSEVLAPLGLSDAEQRDLVAFLESLTGDAVTVEVPEVFDYEERELGVN